MTRGRGTSRRRTVGRGTCGRRTNRGGTGGRGTCGRRTNWRVTGGRGTNSRGTSRRGTGKWNRGKWVTEQGTWDGRNDKGQQRRNTDRERHERGNKPPTTRRGGLLDLGGA